MFPSVFEFELNIVNNICFKKERCFRIILNLSGGRIENKKKQLDVCSMLEHKTISGLYDFTLTSQLV